MQSAVNLCTPPQLAFLMLCCYTPLRTVVSPSSRFCWGFCAVKHFDAVANDENLLSQPNDKHLWRHWKICFSHCLSSFKTLAAHLLLRQLSPLMAVHSVDQPMHLGH